jgi:hypothetical protein
MGVVSWVGASGSDLSDGSATSKSSANAGLGDVAVRATGGIHFSANNNLAVSTWIFAPTGRFTPGTLSNLGMGVWTVIPNVAHTYIWKRPGFEFDKVGIRLIQVATICSMQGWPKNTRAI